MDGDIGIPQQPRRTRLALGLGALAALAATLSLTAVAAHATLTDHDLAERYAVARFCPPGGLADSCVAEVTTNVAALTNRTGTWPGGPTSTVRVGGDPRSYRLDGDFSSLLEVGKAIHVRVWERRLTLVEVDPGMWSKTDQDPHRAADADLRLTGAFGALALIWLLAAWWCLRTGRQT